MRHLEPLTSLAALLAVAPTLAAAQTADVVQARYDRAVARVEEGAFAEAIQDYRAVIDGTRPEQPLHGKALRQAGAAAAGLGGRDSSCAAVDFYMRYLKLTITPPEPQRRQKVEADLPALRARCDAPSPEVLATPAPEALPEPDLTGADAATTTTDPGGLDLGTTLGWTGVGLGVATLAVSGVFFSEALSARDAAGDSNTEKAYGGHVSDMESANDTAVGLLVGGLVAAGAGALILALDPF
jgi:hypothetical protein